MSEALFPELDRNAVMRFFSEKSMAKDEPNSIYQEVASVVFGNKTICEYTNGLFYMHIELLDDERRKSDLPVLLEKLKSIVKKIEAKEKQISEIIPDQSISPKAHTSETLERSPLNAIHVEQENKTDDLENNSSASQKKIKRAKSHDPTVSSTDSTIERERPLMKRSNSTNQNTANLEKGLKREASRSPSPQKKKELKKSDPSQIERLKVRRPLADPKIPLYLSPLIPITTPFKVTSKKILDGEVFFFVLDNKGRRQEITLRQANKAPNQVEIFEHKNLNWRFKQNNTQEKINELMALTFDLSNLTVSQESSTALGLNFINLNPLPVKSNLIKLKNPCFICKQLYQSNMITCTNCKISAHKNCLPDDDLAQEWVNEQDNCHYCTEYKNLIMLSVIGHSLKEFIVIARGKVLGFNVSMVKISFESKDSEISNDFPNVWVELTNPKILVDASKNQT